MSRAVPEAVKRTLRDEVSFGCPVEDCGNPYLEWHHFDPPFSVEAHHRPEGMIALCRCHHIQADNGAFTVEQLREMKARGRERWRLVQGRFNWRRNRLLSVVGASYFYETPVLLQIRDARVLWYERDKDSYMMLNFDIPTVSGMPRASMRNNEWINTGAETDLACPPSAKSLVLQYENGDRLGIEFLELATKDEAIKRFGAGISDLPIEYPVTTVDFDLVIAGSGLTLNTRDALRIGTNSIKLFVSHCGVGLVLR